jgi:hypothetical protein
MSRYDSSYSDPTPPGSSPRGPDSARGRRTAPRRGGPDRLEQGIDRLMSAGRQLVDGVSGARPGSRPPGRGEGRTAGSLPRLEGLGRWVENKLDWILEDEDDWREPWQEPGPGAPTEARPNGQMEPRLEARPVSRRDFAADNPAAGAATTTNTATATTAPSGAMEPAARRRNRRPLEAVSLRGAAAADQDWPDDDSFLVPRWQRSEPAAPTPTRMPMPMPTPTLTPTPTPTSTPAATTAVGRALPRSSRRRQLG